MRIDHTAPDLGSISIEPEPKPIPVGSPFHIRVTYIAGSGGIAAGGAIRFRVPGLIQKQEGRGPVSCSNPGINWVCSSVVPEVNGKTGSEFFTADYLFVSITEGELREGDSVTVSYGDWFEAIAPLWAQKWHVEVAVDVDGSRSAPGSGFYLVENSPELIFVNDRPFRMEVFVPSYTQTGQGFRATVRMLDRYSNIVEDYAGKVNLEVLAGDRKTSLGKYTFEPGMKGVLEIENLLLDQAGVHRVTATEHALGIFARSNPTRTCDGKPPVALFWGDTHCHSRFSADTSAINDMIRSPAEDYDYARNHAALDFCMVTDHIEDQSEEEWKEARRAAADANEPGRFVSFSAFEATFQPLRQEGDKNVYFLDDDQPLVNQGTTEELYENLKARDARVMVIPHLHCPTNWERHDPALERVVEIYAHWGCGLSTESDPPIIPGTERPPESYVHHALEQGARLGFIASADHSCGHPGDDFWWPLSNYNGGLAAVFAPELTREGIWSGLWSRRCYATTRARILLEFEVNKHAMGEEFSDGSPRELEVRAYGTSALSVVRIVKNGKTWKEFDGKRMLDVELSFRDEEPERSTDYYYVHVVQEDGEQAWSSPVWVSRSGEISVH